MNLHRLGHAHSFEAWEEGKLAGGALGIQIGGYITCESMFHRVSNASKAVWGRTLGYLRERGFEWIDTNCVARHQVQYGEEWAPQWKFEEMLREALGRRVAFTDEAACPELPWPIRMSLPVMRAGKGLVRRIVFSHRGHGEEKEENQPQIHTEDSGFQI
jgi:hypothetical protein